MNKQNTIWVILGLVVVIVALMWFSGAYFPTTQPQAGTGGVPYGTAPDCYTTSTGQEICSSATGSTDSELEFRKLGDYSDKINRLGRQIAELYKTPCPVVFLAESTTYESQELIEQLRTICDDLKLEEENAQPTTTGSPVCIDIKIYCPPKYEQVCTSHGNDCAPIEPTSGDRPYDDAYRR